MAELKEIHILAINISQRLAVAEEGVGDIVNFLDEFGDETDEPDVYATIKWRFGGWSTIDTTDYESTAGLN